MMQEGLHTVNYLAPWRARAASRGPIGVSSLARVASTVDAISALPGLDKLAWETLLLEYHPYKYNSFTVNAGAQIWKLTQRIDDQLSDLVKGGGATGLPRILAFQSMVDATVSTEAVIETLYGRLPNEGHRLVLFDPTASAASARYSSRKCSPRVTACSVARSCRSTWKS